MTNGLLVYLRSVFTPSTVSRLTLALNEKAAPVQKALDSLLPAVVGGVLYQASSPEGTAALYQLLTTTPPGEALPASQLLDTDAYRQQAADLGIDLLWQLYGPQTYQLIGAVAQHSRINVGSAITLTGVVTWLLREALHRQLADHSLAQAHWTIRLEDEVEPVWRALPPDLAGSLGWFLGPDPREPVRPVAPLASEPTGEAVTGLSWLRWSLYLVVPLLLLLLFLGLLRALIG
ncbi:DUF937 domain-containing protein [Fibrella forsythiae]|uniref:DUF937 domain-containing protein n=1 Tax=Fibrella forsythiae TaxID=2817061 RepID=A0ABS3JTI4_9BACT|nr:DUF937 domain-containing protein [Fibrella forsythiae]MBO0953330.1 DUF937 domain-containing protein [Fibrella forsythiae]